MAIKEITKSVSAKVNLGNYQSLDFFVSMKMELETEDANEIAIVANTLRACCNETMLNDLREHFKARGKAISDKQIRRQFGLAAEDEFG